MIFHSILIAGLLSGLQGVSGQTSTELPQVNFAAHSCDSTSKQPCASLPATHWVTAGSPVKSHNRKSRCCSCYSAIKPDDLPIHLLTTFLFPVNMFLHVKDYLIQAFLHSPLCTHVNLRTSMPYRSLMLMRTKDTIDHPWSLCFGAFRHDSVFNYEKGIPGPEPFPSCKSSQLLYFLLQSFLLPFGNAAATTAPWEVCDHQYQHNPHSIRTKDPITDPYASFYDEAQNAPSILPVQDTIPAHSLHPTTMWKKETTVAGNRSQLNTRNQNRFLYFHSRRLSPHTKLVNSRMPDR